MLSWQDKEVTACRNNNKSIYKKADAEKESDDKEKGDETLVISLLT